MIWYIMISRNIDRFAYVLSQRVVLSDIQDDLEPLFHGYWLKAGQHFSHWAPQVLSLHTHSLFPSMFIGQVTPSPWPLQSQRAIKEIWFTT